MHSAVEYGHEGESRILIEHFVEVAHAEKHGEDHGETERAVDCNAGHDGARHHNLCIVDFFGQLEQHVSALLRIVVAWIRLFMSILT